ncbi:MAG: glutamate--tRNA ligase [bacterium]
MVDNKKIRVRFAPSPTGHLHVGNARVAIFNWLYARHNNATYLLRVEDTDTQRSTKEYLDSQLQSLTWLDLLPDEPIHFQMSRVEEHKKVVDDLLNSGHAYPCFCEPGQLEQKRAALALDGKTYKYEGTCRNVKYTQQDLKKPHAIRFMVPDNCESVEFEDLIRGRVKVDIEHLDDFVIVRRDGTPTYNFVVVLDDIFMKITHVIRGEDHIPNTHKQILIYNALNAQLPKFAHLPMILGPAGNKLSKRDATVSVREYMQQGFLADALFNYLVRLGWSHGDQEIFTKDEMVQFFDFDHVGKKGAIFDIKKLEWLNGVYLRQKSYNDLLNAVTDLGNNYYQELQNLWSADQLAFLFDQYKQRAVKLLDMVLDIISLAHDPDVLNLDLIKKWKTPSTKDLLDSFCVQLETATDLSHDSLLALANSVCEKNETKLVSLAQPLRLALTGKIMSPGVFELINILGSKISIKRIRFLIETLKVNA